MRNPSKQQSIKKAVDAYVQYNNGNTATDPRLMDEALKHYTATNQRTPTNVFADMHFLKWLMGESVVMAYAKTIKLPK